MKKTYQYIALAVLTIGLAACTQEDDFTPQGNQKDAPLAIASAGVANLTTRATIDSNDNLVEGSMGVFVTSTSGGRYEGSNIKWTYNNGWNLDAATVVLYENDDTKQQVGAYYPYTAELTDEGKFAIELPEVFGSDYEDYDYLYADYAALGSNPVIIAMNHLLSKVTVSISTMGTEISSDAVQRISLFNVSRTASWEVPTSTLSGFGTANETTTLYANDTNDDQKVDNYVGYALPHTATTLGIRVTMDSGRSFVAQAPITDGLAGGNHYLISMKIGKDAVTVSDVSVQPWGNGGTLESGVAEEKFLSIDGTVYNSASELQDAVKNKLSQEGVTSVTINGYLSEELHKAVISAIGEVKTVGAVTNGYLWEGSVTYTVYEDFTNATATWTDGMTLTMLGDATDLTEYIETTAKGLVLDLNGHTLASSATLCTIWIDGDSSSELTIRDTKGGGYVQGNVYAVYSPSGMSKLCLESGTVKRVDANGDFTMTGGTIRNEEGDALNTSSDLVKIVVSGGEIYSSKYAIYSYTTANIVVTGTAKLTGVEGIIDDRGGSNFTVTGGIFSHDPSEWVDQDAYTVTENSDGTWSVTAKE